MWFALLLASQAHAASTFIAVERGGQRTDDPAWDTLAGPPSMRTTGLSAGYALLPVLDLTASWHYRATGLRHAYESAAAPGADLGYQAAWIGHRYGLGVALEPELSHWIRPYVGIQGTLTQGTLRLDDDSSTDDNPNQIQARAFAPGFTTQAGARLAMGLPEWPVLPSLHLEMGYGWTTQLDYGDLGDMNLRGFAIRGGVGVMF